MKAGTLFTTIFSTLLSASCNDIDDKPAIVEAVNLGTQIDWQGSIGCSQGALTYLSNDRLIIGVDQPQFIDLTTNAATDIAFDSDDQMAYYPIRATETHLFNISYEVDGSAIPKNVRISKFDIATDTESYLADGLSPFYLDYVYLLGPAIINDDVLYFKEGSDSAVYRRNLYDNTPETTLPIKGVPVFFYQSGNLLLYATRKGYRQYDLASQQSSFLSPFTVGSENRVSAAFRVKDKRFIMHGHYATGHPVYLRDLVNNEDILISDTGSNGGVAYVRISPDEKYLCFWGHDQIYESGSLLVNTYSLSLHDFEARKTEVVFSAEHRGAGTFPCRRFSPDFSANFSPDSRKLTYIFHGKLYQYSLTN